MISLLLIADFEIMSDEISPFHILFSLFKPFCEVYHVILVSNILVYFYHYYLHLFNPFCWTTKSYFPLLWKSVTHFAPVTDDVVIKLWLWEQKLSNA